MYSVSKIHHSLKMWKINKYFELSGILIWLVSKEVITFFSYYIDGHGLHRSQIEASLNSGRASIYIKPWRSRDFGDYCLTHNVMLQDLKPKYPPLDCRNGWGKGSFRTHSSVTRGPGWDDWQLRAKKHYSYILFHALASYIAKKQIPKNTVTHCQVL